LGGESAFNTVSTSGHDIPKASFSVPSPFELIESDEMTSDPNPTMNEKGLQAGDGWSFDAMVTADVFGLLAYWFFGAYAVAAAGAAYDHTSKISASTDPSSLSISIGDLGLTKYDIYYGLYLNSFGLSISKTSDMLKVSVGGVSSGKYLLNQATDFDAAPDTYSDRRHVLPACTLSVDGSAAGYLTGVEWTVTREIFPLQPLDGNLYAAGAVLGDYSVACTLTGWRDAADTMFGLDDGAEHTVKINSPRPAASDSQDIDIEMNECLIYATEGYSMSGDAPADFSVSVNPYKDDHADASAIKVTTTSDIADYSAL
jgi:hypothetical protein